MNISKWNYSNTESNNYGTNSIAVGMGYFTVYFSYNTVVAFSNGDGLVVSENN